VRVGVIGLGFMGATHVAAYQAAARDGLACTLAAVCDKNPDRRKGLLADVGGNLGGGADSTLAFDPGQVRGYASAAELLADDGVDLVSICTQTDTHAELAIAALRAGKHVLVEKPVALTPEQIRQVLRAAVECSRLCMPAMCMRFWPAWAWLKDRITRHTYGRCTGLTLTRTGSAPTWSPEFYQDPARSGGALVDLHIHDADFVRFCFGDPDAVTSAGHLHGGAVSHVTTLYHYPSGGAAPAHVVAEGGWLAAGTPFQMRYLAAFEHATADFCLGRADELRLHHREGTEAIETSTLSGYDHEIRHLVRAVAAGSGELDATLEDAVAVAELLDAEQRSVIDRQTIQL